MSTERKEIVDPKIIIRVLNTSGWVKHVEGETQEQFIDRWMRANAKAEEPTQSKLSTILAAEKVQQQSRQLRNRTVYY
jgi:hypothetical protein